MSEATKNTQPIGEFLDWANQEHGIMLAYYPPTSEHLYSCPFSLEKLLAEWQNIDLDKVEEERREMLKKLREDLEKQERETK